MKFIKLSIILVSVALLNGCAFLPAAKTAKALADQACQLYFGERMGLGPEDVAKFYCDNSDILDVFLACDGDKECLASAGPKAAGLMGISGE